MTLRKIAATALAAAALTAAAAFFFWSEKPAQALRPLAGVKAADLSKIEIDSEGRTVVLENAAGQWRLSAPVSDEAEAAL